MGGSLDAKSGHFEKRLIRCRRVPGNRNCDSAFQPISIGFSVERDDTGSTEAKIVLQGEACTFDLRFVRRSAQLTSQLVALGKAGRSDRVPLGEQAAARIDEIGRAVQQECRDRSRMPSSA
eukprot:TRINITY_DN98167_c0_g1_i1.p1 TRINITY_DN98167_c0_g1~~TRINITY_DN98167_c0_g1_i1.p1  ORF type:complete len:121 (-),score=15.88 TRINITY_DN98167_c0_g1_i1:10-372(-)